MNLPNGTINDLAWRLMKPGTYGYLRFGQQGYYVRDVGMGHGRYAGSSTLSPRGETVVRQGAGTRKVPVTLRPSPKPGGTQESVTGEQSTREDTERNADPSSSAQNESMNTLVFLLLAVPVGVGLLLWGLLKMGSAPLMRLRARLSEAVDQAASESPGQPREIEEPEPTPEQARPGAAPRLDRAHNPTTISSVRGSRPVSSPGHATVFGELTFLSEAQYYKGRFKLVDWHLRNNIPRFVKYLREELSQDGAVDRPIEALTALRPLVAHAIRYLREGDRGEDGEENTVADNERLRKLFEHIQKEIYLVILRGDNREAGRVVTALIQHLLELDLRYWNNMLADAAEQVTSLLHVWGRGIVNPRDLGIHFVINAPAPLSINVATGMVEINPLSFLGVDDRFHQRMLLHHMVHRLGVRQAVNQIPRGHEKLPAISQVRPLVEEVMTILSDADRLRLMAEPNQASDILRERRQEVDRTYMQLRRSGNAVYADLLQRLNASEDLPGQVRAVVDFIHGDAGRMQNVGLGEPADPNLVVDVINELYPWVRARQGKSVRVTPVHTPAESDVQGDGLQKDLSLVSVDTELASEISLVGGIDQVNVRPTPLPPILTGTGRFQRRIQAQDFEDWFVARSLLLDEPLDFVGHGAEAFEEVMPILAGLAQKYPASNLWGGQRGIRVAWILTREEEAALSDFVSPGVTILIEEELREQGPLSVDSIEEALEIQYQAGVFLEQWYGPQAIWQHYSDSDMDLEHLPFKVFFLNTPLGEIKGPEHWNREHLPKLFLAFKQAA